MTDPKHLPPRDCHVYVTDDAYGAIWIHALHLPAEMTWCSAETEVRIDPSRVITWRELPEVE